jgi:hypothetical protein
MTDEAKSHQNCHRRPISAMSTPLRYLWRQPKSSVPVKATGIPIHSRTRISRDRPSAPSIRVNQSVAVSNFKTGVRGCVQKLSAPPGILYPASKRLVISSKRLVAKSKCFVPALQCLVVLSKRLASASKRFIPASSCLVPKLKCFVAASQCLAVLLKCLVSALKRLVISLKRFVPALKCLVPKASCFVRKQCKLQGLIPKKQLARPMLNLPRV